MKYVLLGGSGFIGKHLAIALSQKHDVTIIGHSANFSLKGTTYKQLDFTHCHNFSNFIKDADVIIHMISTIIPSNDLSSVNQEISDNIFPTTTLLDNAAKLGKEVVFISSGGTIYGESNTPNAESHPTNPICNYGISKLFIEKYLGLYHHFYNLSYKIIRLSNPYSGEIYHGKKQGIIPIIIDNIINNETISIWGKGQVRDYIHIDDVTKGIIAILNYRGKKHTFNIGSGTGHTTEEIIDLVANKLNKKPLLKYFPARKCDVKKNILDITLAKRETGWSPTISLSKGIDRIINTKTEELS